MSIGNGVSDKGRKRAIVGPRAQVHGDIVISRFKQVARGEAAHLVAMQAAVVWNAVHCHIRIVQLCVHMVLTVTASAAVLMQRVEPVIGAVLMQRAEVKQRYSEWCYWCLGEI